MSDPVSADDGRRLWAQRSEAGLPLVLCHGGPGLWDMFKPVAPALEGMAKVAWCGGFRTGAAECGRWSVRA